jgi:hypothetical protein
MKFISFFLVAVAASTEDPQTLQDSVRDLYSKIQDRLFQESTVMNRLVVTAERNKDRDDESLNVYKDFIEQANEMRTKTQPFYVWSINSDISHVLESGDFAKIKQILDELQQWNDYFEF